MSRTKFKRKTHKLHKHNLAQGIYLLAGLLSLFCLSAKMPLYILFSKHLTFSNNFNSLRNSSFTTSFVSPWFHVVILTLLLTLNGLERQCQVLDF